MHLFHRWKVDPPRLVAVKIDHRTNFVVTRTEQGKGVLEVKRCSKCNAEKAVLVMADGERINTHSMLWQNSYYPSNA